MKKSELENGMIVELRNGNKYIVIKDYTNKRLINKVTKDVLLEIKGKGYMSLDTYTDDLLRPSRNEVAVDYDIIKVYYIEYLDTPTRGLKLLWERDLALEEFKDSLNKLNEVVKILKNRYILDVEIYNYKKDFTVDIKFYNFRLTHQEYIKEIEELVRYKIKDIKEKSIDEIADDISNKIDKLILDYFKQ